MTDHLAVTEYRRAVDVLTASGFTPSRAHDLLTCRKHLLDEYAMAALTGLLSAYGNDREALTIANMALHYAKASMEVRRPS